MSKMNKINSNITHVNEDFISKTHKIISDLKNDLLYKTDLLKKYINNDQRVICNENSFSFVSQEDDDKNTLFINKLSELSDENTTLKRKILEMNSLYDKLTNENIYIIEKYNDVKKNSENMDIDKKLYQNEKEELLKNIENLKLVNLRLHKKINKYNRILFNSNTEADNSFNELLEVDNTNQENLKETKLRKKSDYQVDLNSNEKLEQTESVTIKPNHLKGSILNEDKFLYSILKYSNLKEIFYLKNSSKFLYTKLSFFTKIKDDIKFHIDSLKSIKSKLEHKINSENNLSLYYNKNHFSPGLALRNQILLCCNFIELNVKKPLGLDSSIPKINNTSNTNNSTIITNTNSSSISNNTNQSNKKNDSLFNTFINFFDGSTNKNNMFQKMKNFLLMIWT